MAHSVAFYLRADFQLLDLAGPLDALCAANDAAGRTLYRPDVLSRRGGRVTSSAGVTIATAPSNRASCDTLVVVGGRAARTRQPQDAVAVQRLAAAASRIASVCLGAFRLAKGAPSTVVVRRRIGPARAIFSGAIPT